MNEDQWHALSKSQQDASYREGFEAAKAKYVPVLMEHLRILADLRAKVEDLLETAKQVAREHEAEGATTPALQDRAAAFAYARVRDLLDEAVNDG